ncbi:hypothetical protein CALCODRAFT_310609 [Calocera cornea HHB12733]|uniref:Uncharacterized protein n=1 Tax=Calocera cornea HHB12733 TaxID=1353952 RepID=A0A165FET8_9BASI|nr:hypothetical protein CALCODRAFT_310609 [Calocera cornea HHB12733]
MNNHVDQVPEMFAEDEVSVSDYVENPDDAQDIAIQLCSMLSAAGTSVNENGDFVMDAAQLKAFAALLRRNRFLAGKKVRKYYKRRSRRVLDQIPEDDIETSLTSANRGERDKFGLGSTLRGKVVAIENKLPLSELPPSPAAADEDGAEVSMSPPAIATVEYGHSTSTDAAHSGGGGGRSDSVTGWQVILTGRSSAVPQLW